MICDIANDSTPLRLHNDDIASDNIGFINKPSPTVTFTFADVNMSVMEGTKIFHKHN